MQFDATDTWTLQNPAPVGTTALLPVALHEIGHALGLRHSTNANSVMYPFTATVTTLR